MLHLHSQKIVVFFLSILQQQAYYHHDYIIITFKQDYYEFFGQALSYPK